MGSPTRGLYPLLPGGNLYNCNYPRTCESPALGSCLYLVSAPPLLLPILLYFLLYIFSCRRFFSTNLLVVHINNCLVNNFSFGVPVGGGKLRVFLLHHLVLSQNILYNECNHFHNSPDLLYLHCHSVTYVFQFSADLGKPCAVLSCFSHLQPTLCYPMDCSPPGFSVHGILKARVLVWVAMPFSRGSSPPRDVFWFATNIVKPQLRQLGRFDSTLFLQSVRNILRITGEE